MNYDWNQYLNQNNVDRDNFQWHWTRFNNIVNEAQQMSQAAAAAASSSAAGSAGGRKSKPYFSITVNINYDGEGLQFVFETTESRKFEMDWGDGNTETYDAQIGNTFSLNHNYTSIGVYNIKVYEPTYLKTLMIMPYGFDTYTSIVESEFKKLTNLVGTFIWSNINNIESGSLNRVPLEFIGFKFLNISNLTKSMVGSPTLKQLYIKNSTGITSIETGIFNDSPYLEDFTLENTPIESTEVVDNFLIDLYNNNLSNCTIVLNVNDELTYRTSGSTYAVEGLESNGCGIGVKCIDCV